MFGNRAVGHFAQIKRTAFGKAASLMMSAFLLLIAGPVFAQGTNAVTGGAQTVAQNAGLASGDLATIVGRVISGFLGLLGIIAVVLIIYAGYLWTTSAGDETKITSAKNTLKNAIIGLVLIFSSWAIVNFILGLLDDQSGNSTISAEPGSPYTRLNPPGDSNFELGNGIIEYHYPEPGQLGVPRNIRIGITFKKPLVLSSLIKNYDDGGTYTLDDDRLCPSASPCPTEPLLKDATTAPVFKLNTDNVSIIPTTDLGTPTSGTEDERFSVRYPIAKNLSPAPEIRVTPVSLAFDENQQQKIVIIPDSVNRIGSTSVDVNYRVALRGGATGVRVWTVAVDATNDKPTPTNAFKNAYADGGYFWGFTTSTVLDTTPPKIVAVIPRTSVIPGARHTDTIDRNQILQVYFNEPVDPTTATGVVGSGGGFSNVKVEAKCREGLAGCGLPDGQPVNLYGAVTIGNRYRTLEFVPSTPCDGVGGVTENSCGSKVFCLPAMTSLDLQVRAATVGTEAPLASLNDGVTDMVGNSLDGNLDGIAQGPDAVAPLLRLSPFYWNSPQTEARLPTVSDSVRIAYQSNANIDLEPPKITALDPPPLTSDEPVLNFPDGPAKVSPQLEPSITFNKSMRTESMKTGGFVEQDQKFGSPFSTLVLRARECAKVQNAVCEKDVRCPCVDGDPPGFFYDAGEPITILATDKTPEHDVTKITFRHPGRAFYTANDLGYTDQDIEDGGGLDANIPIYVPIVRAKIQDTKQNCFWPSTYTPTAPGAECLATADNTSCCNRSGLADAGFPGECSPY